MPKPARILVVSALACAAAPGAFAQSQADISAKIESSLPTNGRGQITGSSIRDVFNSLNGARGKPNGIADLDALGKLPSDRTPDTLKPNTLQILGAGSTGIISGMSARSSASGGVSRALSDIFDNTINVRDFGAKDDDATDNTAAFQAAINAASDKGRTLEGTASSSGSGRFRLGNVDWKKVNVRLDEGVQLFNLDGSKYTGGYQTGGGQSLFDAAILGNYSLTRRIMSASGQAIAMGKNGDRERNFLTFSGIMGSPYAIASARRDFSLIGQGGPTSASFASLGNFVNVYDVSNGPGINFTCTATSGSNVLTACTPSPTGTRTATNPDGSPFSFDGGKTVAAIPNISNPCK